MNPAIKNFAETGSDDKFAYECGAEASRRCASNHESRNLGRFYPEERPDTAPDEVGPNDESPILVGLSRAGADFTRSNLSSTGQRYRMGF